MEGKKHRLKWEKINIMLFKYHQEKLNKIYAILDPEKASGDAQINNGRKL